jgi:crossover junction endodeoxyribonuclease RuvC
VLGIDPGLDGGIALLDLSCLGTVIVTPMFVRKSPRGKGRQIDVGMLRYAIADWRTKYLIEFAAVEEVHAMPKQGVTSTFTFGEGYGRITGALEALSIDIVDVPATVWKKKVLAGLPHDKAGAISFCKQHYPNVLLIPCGKRVEHDGVADALCIAEYARLLRAERMTCESVT